MASLKELAKAAGVSEATASLAMNDRPGVNASTKEHIRQLADRMGYIPNRTAQNLARRTSNLIGMIVPNLINTNYGLVVQLAEDWLRARGYKIIIATSKNNPQYEEEMIEQFVAFRVEGVVIFPMVKGNPDPSYVNLLKKHNIPFVFLGGRYREINGTCVMEDFYESTFRAASYLYERGGRSFCLQTGCRSIASTQLRLKGIQDALSARGLDFPAENHFALESSDYSCAYALFDRLLTEGRNFDCVITVNDPVGLAAYAAATKHGLRVPEDLSIISSDITLITLPTNITRINLTNIQQNTTRIVETALEELFAHIAGSKEIKTIYIRSDLIIGDSTR
ncbi:MAG: LacI family DNA-binding transcriptional regulator [Faecousia sp.]